MGVDRRTNIDQAWMDISYRSAVQGNLDPVPLFAPLHELRAKIAEMLKRTGTQPGRGEQPSPFVTTQPTSARAGADVKILGTNLTGATSVTFNLIN